MRSVLYIYQEIIVFIRDYREMCNRQLLKFTFCVCLLPLFFSCSSERDEGDEGSGTLHIQVKANPEVVVGTNTRVSDATEQEVPDVNDFSFSIFRGETLRKKWGTLADYLSDDEFILRAGSNYSAKATYGDVNREGFELPYYEGSEPFAIAKGKTTNVELTCYLNNAKLSIVYTDAFKDYFATYTSEVSTSLGNTVEYTSSEERYAYFKPGDLSVRVKARKKVGYSQEVTLKAKDFTAEARHAYILTLDVDAGTPSLKVSFSDDIPNQEPVTIEISDEALSAPTPYFKANGFDVNQTMDVVEGKSAEASEVYAYLHAAGGIANCSLVTHSTSLIEQGWPEMVDLANISAETLQVMKNLGLQIIGLGEKKDKIAKIDFTNVIPFLEYTDEETEHVFELRATDRLAKENQEPLVLRVHSNDNKFAVSAGEPVLYGTTKMKAKLTLDGDPNKVTYRLKKDGTVQEVRPSAIKSDGISHELTFKFDESQYSDIEVEAHYLRRTGVLTSALGEPEVGLSLQYPGDVWTKQATLQLTGDIDGWSLQRSKKSQDGSNGAWNKEEGNLSGSTVSVLGLTPGTGYAYRLIKEDAEGDLIGTSKLLDIVTEEEIQIPNSGFEEWYDQKLYSTLGEIYTFYPFKENSEAKDRWWDTSNTKTTPNPGSAAAWYYRSFPGTVPTSDGHNHTASYHLNKFGKKGLTTGGYNNSTSVEIATVGWGDGNTWSAFGKKAAYKTAGSLFVGTYDGEEKYGKDFSSRPTRLKFVYKYYSYNKESTAPYIRIDDAEGNMIGYGKLTISGNVTDFTEAIIPISYEGNEAKKAAKITIVFKSTDSANPQTEALQGDVGAFGGYWDSRHIGSVLTIDDVSLIYDK